MVRTPGLGHIVLVLALLARFLFRQQVERHTGVWDPRLVPSARC